MEDGPAETEPKPGGVLPGWLERLLGNSQEGPSEQRIDSWGTGATGRCYHWNELKLVLGVKRRTGTNCCWGDADRTSKKIGRSKLLQSLPVFQYISSAPY